MNVNEILNVWWAQLSEWVGAFVAGLPQLIAAVVIFSFFWFLSKGAKKTAQSVFEHIDAPLSIERLLASLLRIAVVLFGVMIALGVLNLDKTVTSMLAGLGIVGIALGFAFQDIAANFIAGLILVLRRPFKVGDVIKVADQMGTVESIELRSTILKSFQGQIMHIPNQKIFSDVISNYSELGSQRIDLECGVSYNDDLEDVQYSTLQSIKKLKFTKDDPKPVLHFEEFGGSSINFVIRFWIDFSIQPDFLEARSETIKAINKLYKEKGFTIPYPITAIDLDQQGFKGFNK